MSGDMEMHVMEPAKIGFSSTPITLAVRSERLRLFARVIETSSQTQASAVAKSPARTLAPLTLPFCLFMDDDVFNAFLEDIGIDINITVHGKQRFKYHQPVCEGDQLVAAMTLTDRYIKKGGRMQFTEITQTFHDQAGELVCESIVTLITIFPEGNSDEPH